MSDFSTDDAKGTKVVQMGQIDISKSRLRPVDTTDLPILPTRNLVMFPGVTIPINIGRESSLRLAEYAYEHHIPIGVVCQLEPETENPTVADLYDIGVVVEVLQILPLPDDTKAIIVVARDKIMVKGAGTGKTLPGILSADVTVVKDHKPRAKYDMFLRMVDNIKQTAEKLIKNSGPDGGQEFIYNLNNMDSPELIINMVATNFPMSTATKVDLLKQDHLRQRANELLVELNMCVEYSNITQHIQEKTKQAMNEQKRAAFLQQQMESIRTELYGDEDDASVLAQRAEEKNFPEHVDKAFNKELDKLRRLNPSTPDYSVIYTYLETLLDLPWNSTSDYLKDFDEAEAILEGDHYGLEKVKERILEQIALLMNNPEGRSPIICLVGAPGVGKTSLGKSIASALGREYQRISLGGLHDEAELRGHRRTYIGAAPGRVIDALKKCSTTNPVLLLDEVDKIGKDYKGDPAAALLEVLDPEQNCHFHDNYVDVDYDLSNVLFIATANTLSTLSRPLLDRMEIIDIPGYLLEEKIEIAKRHLIPKKLAESNMTDEEVTFTDDAIRKIIESYTSESGVRQLEKNIASIIRKLVLAKMRKGESNVTLTPDYVVRLLGVEKVSKELYENNDFAGVVAGLAWTEVGGEILYVEASLAPGKGEKLTLTGNLGDVMKESAVIALQYVKAHADRFGIPAELFDKYNLHVHVPEGAIPKDGPSAGITMVTAMVSAFTQRKVKEKLAMTGEITLRGKVLPVGGIREKILAAKRAGINTIVLCDKNRKDIMDIPEKYLDGMTFHYVETIPEVIEIAVTDEPAVDAIDFNPTK
ncbi:MAG: endopeptidase La [Muribaculaceae bacterium]|nr:endopeptidase La [Muribaculaceae bacterium]